MIARFLEVATISPSYPEFMMEIVFRAKADVGTKEFFKSYIKPLIYSDSIDDSPEFAYVDHHEMKKIFRKKLYALSWLRAYLDVMLPQSKPHDDVSVLHC